MSPSDTTAHVRELAQRLAGLTLVDAHHLGRRLERARNPRRGDAAAALAALTAQIDAAEQRALRRGASVPAIRYPDELPITARRDDIAAAIRDHQVVVVAGETGSGKTTQLPKICLELGRGVRGLIGHTQPRRLAARTVADRIAEELGTGIGQAVGYAIRFTDKVGADTLVKLMTDGILLAEIQRDRRLLRYDTLIVDEAHERSLNIDFLLGYLHRLLPTRPDLKVIITSATIDPDRFARHFADRGGRPAPVVEVSGRTYPVQVRYRPLVPDEEEDDADDPDHDSRSRGGRNARPARGGRVNREGGSRNDEADPQDQATGVCEAVDELLAEGPGDILVFLSGEREIRDTADALRSHLRIDRDGPSSPRHVEILPLYARLSNAEQHRVFAPHPGRRIVLATNVAETSLTVPGIRYVIDAGTARISRYSLRRKVQRLPIEAISQASANQRAGRCGRVADGICIRLYAEDDYASRPEFTDPEILRTNLASVILQMAANGFVGRDPAAGRTLESEVAGFGFVEPPDRRSIADGIALLQELGALTPGGLTELGRKLAQLPVDPRIGRMIVEADRLGALREVIVIAAALSIQDPRERPVDAQEQARAKHARFADPTSDFLGYLNLWRYLREQQRELSTSRFRRLCTTDYLHYLRVREWQDLVAQLREVAASIGLRWNTAPADEHAVHLALLSGLLTHIGMRDPEPRAQSARARPDQHFVGPRNARFAIFPGSALAKKPPGWVMAAELVETSRLWARTAARIEPDWVESQAAHLVKRTYAEPHWERKRGAVVAFERVTLHGLPLVAGRKVDYARIDPALSRELFLRCALVEGDWDTHHRFLARNRALREDAEELEHRARRRGLVVDDEALFAFYDARVPADVVSAQHFDAWWKKARRRRPTLLDLDAESLRTEEAGQVRAEDYPERWDAGGESLPLSYQFEPGTDADGVTAHIPLAVLNRLPATGFDWQVPGLREELVAALIRSLPKSVRRSFSPAGTYAAAVLPRLRPDAAEPLTVALERELGRRNGVPIGPEDWDWGRVPAHLRMTFRVEGERGETLGEGKDLAELTAALAPQVRSLVAAGAATLEQADLSGWPELAGDTIPVTYEQVRDGRVVQGYPALVAEGAGAALRVLADPGAAHVAMVAGTRALLLGQVQPPVKALLARLPNRAKLALAAAPHANGTALFADCTEAAVAAIVTEHGGPTRDRSGFDALLRAVRTELPARFEETVRHAATILTAAQEIDAALATAPSGPAVTDMRRQYDALITPGFVTAAGTDRLTDIVRYLRGIGRRLDKLGEAPDRDGARMAQVHQLTREYGDFRAALPPARRDDADVVAIRWMLEELRISLFAQALGTAHPVSEKRILKAMDEAEARTST